MRNTFRDASLQAEFQAKGYVIVPLMSAEEAAEQRRRALEMLPTELCINDPQGALYDTQHDEGLRAKGGELVRAILEPRLDALLDDYRFEGGTVIAKLAGSGRLPVHQHSPLTRDIYEPVVHGWCTLDDVDGDSGTLRVVPGSHQLTRHIQSFDSPPFFGGFADRMEHRFTIDLPLRAGEAVIFERSLLHGSAPNRTSRPSIRFLTGNFPAESPYCILAPHSGDRFEAMEADSATVDTRLICLGDGDRSPFASAGMLPSRNEAITEVEFEALLSLGKRVRPGYDPIDEVRRAGGAGAGGWGRFSSRGLRLPSFISARP